MRDWQGLGLPRYFGLCGQRSHGMTLGDILGSRSLLLSSVREAQREGAWGLTWVRAVIDATGPWRAT